MTAAGEPVPTVELGLYPLPAPAAYVDMGGPALLAVHVRIDRAASTRLEIGRGPR